MLSKLLLSLSLAVAPIVSVSAQAENTFDTFQTADKYLEDFDYLREQTYRLSTADIDKIDYEYNYYIYYVFPNYYDMNFVGNFYEVYSNDYYRFFVNTHANYEVVCTFSISNYNGLETEFSFLALNEIGMFEVMQYDKEEKFNSISIYNSFYNFFTGFFPNEVVAEYHGIFTFVIVAFLLFLVFGFVFFLFRVIRRLVGFK